MSERGKNTNIEMSTRVWDQHYDVVIIRIVFQNENADDKDRHISLYCCPFSFFWAILTFILFVYQAENSWFHSGILCAYLNVLLRSLNLYVCLQTLNFT